MLPAYVRAFPGSDSLSKCRLRYLSLHPGTLQVLADGHGFFSWVGILHLILGPVFLYSFEIPTI